MHLATTSAGTSINYWIALVKQTRSHGSCYVHTPARAAAYSPFRAFTAYHGDREVVFSYAGWGRSLQSGGHKYKVHARYADTGLPVPSKVLGFLTA